MNHEDLEFLESLRKDFLEEIFDLLSKCEGSLLNYEKGFEEAYLQEHMRTLHSIKGSASAVEYDTVASSIHAVESLGQRHKKETLVELSLLSIDGIRNAIEQIKLQDMKAANVILEEMHKKIK